MNAKYVVFDLDDTLYYEIDYLKSAYHEIAQLIDKANHVSVYLTMLNWYKEGYDVFGKIQKLYSRYSKDELLNVYRNHFPSIKLNDGATELFQHCISHNYKLGLITDGRSITQRNKIKALGIDSLFSKIIVSEEFGSTKLALKNFKIFETTKSAEYYYIADNPSKDFIAPNKLGWITICLLNQGFNIHPQDMNCSIEQKPQHFVNNLIEVIDLV